MHKLKNHLCPLSVWKALAWQARASGTRREYLLVGSTAAVPAADGPCTSRLPVLIRHEWLKTFAIFLSVIAVGTVAPITSSSAAGAEIAYVDIQAVIAKSKMGQQMSERFNSMVSEKEKSVEGERKAIQEMEDAFKKDRDVMGKEEREKREKELRTKVQAFQRLVAESREEMNKQNAEFTREAMGPVLEVVAEIAKKEEITAVFEKGRSGLLFANPEVDLTEKVIERLDAKK